MAPAAGWHVDEIREVSYVGRQELIGTVASVWHAVSAVEGLDPGW